MKIYYYIIAVTSFLFFLLADLEGQTMSMSKERILMLTPEWNGERFEDGRPKVSDGILERMKAISLEEKSSVLLVAFCNWLICLLPSLLLFG